MMNATTLHLEYLSLKADNLKLLQDKMELREALQEMDNATVWYMTVHFPNIGKDHPLMLAITKAKAAIEKHTL